MDEYISREAANKEIIRFIGYLDEDMIYRLRLALNRLPAADVKPVVRGEWKQTGDHSAVCTACGKTTLVGGADRTGKALIHKGLFNFCPNCGADMRSETEDKDADV